MTTSPDRRTALDTNVLIYSVYADAEHHRAARSLVDQAKNPDAALCLAPQVLAEFYAVVTNPRRVTEPKSPEVALETMNTFLTLPGITLLSVPLDIVSRLMALLRQHPVIGRKVFDVQLVATLLGNGVRKLHTFNRADFAPFSEIEVLTPVAP
jgi:toxin-antitoxin system PIN domain toxin